MEVKEKTPGAHKHPGGGTLPLVFSLTTLRPRPSKLMVDCWSRPGPDDQTS